MDPISPQQRRWLLVLVLFAQAGVLLAEISSAITGASRWNLWLLMVPPFCVHASSAVTSWYLCRALPLARTRPSTTISAQLASAVLSSALLVAVAYGWSHFVGPPLPELFRGSAVLILVFGVFLYSSTAAAHYLSQAREASSRARAEAVELRLLAREAELSALRSQLDPHFLFNCLNTISSLTSSDPAGAREMCVRLAGFLRSSLALGRRERFFLADEMRLVDEYLAVEKVRFGDRLRVRRSVARELAESVSVLPLILQPLVENAVRHGVAQLLDGGEIEIGARQADQRGDLLLRVSNPRDPDRATRAGHGIGLANVRRRLALAHGERATLRIEEEADRFTVVIRIPGAVSRVTPDRPASS